MAQPIEPGGPRQDQPQLTIITNDMLGMAQGMEVITPIATGLVPQMTTEEQWDQANSRLEHCGRAQKRAEDWHEEARGWLSRRITATMVKVCESNTQRARERFSQLDVLLHPEDQPDAVVLKTVKREPAVQTYPNHGVAYLGRSSDSL